MAKGTWASAREDLKSRHRAEDERFSRAGSPWSKALQQRPAVVVVAADAVPVVRLAAAQGRTVAVQATWQGAAAPH